MKTKNTTIKSLLNAKQTDAAGGWIFKLVLQHGEDGALRIAEDQWPAGLLEPGIEPLGLELGFFVQQALLGWCDSGYFDDPQLNPDKTVQLMVTRGSLFVKSASPNPGDYDSFFNMRDALMDSIMPPGQAWPEIT